MDWQEIINNGELFYASRSTDEQLRKWSLKKTRCDVTWYESVPLDDIDFVICSALSLHDEQLSEDDLARMLGFNTINDYESSPKRYADHAEKEIFRNLIKPVLDWGLITKKQVEGEPVLYSLSFIGKHALQNQEKYKFFSGILSLFENARVDARGLAENEFFPFKQALGVTSSLLSKTEIKYDQVQDDFFEPDESQLAKRLLLQSEERFNLHSSSISNWFDIISTEVDYRIYLYDGVYYPIVFIDNSLSLEATDLINKPYNSAIRDEKVEWGHYLMLLNDPEAVLDYRSLSPFMDILSLRDFLSDTRLAWDDVTLFDYISQNANANDWQVISKQCPIEVLEKHVLEDFPWNWSTVSRRISTGFIVSHPNDCKWDFSEISNRDDIRPEDIKALLGSVSSSKADWDWDIILPLLDSQYIADNISRFDFDLTAFTKDNKDISSTLIPLYPEKKWDWRFISKNYELPFILKNIQIFEYVDDEGNNHNRLDLGVVLQRAFSSSVYAVEFCRSDVFRSVISQNRSSLSGYSANNSDFVWSPEIIQWFESFGFIQWPSGRYTKGFECNPYLAWTASFFDEFSQRIATEQGFCHVSSIISDASIVDRHESFDWDWGALSGNKRLISQEAFVRTHLSKLDLMILLPSLDGSFIESLIENGDLLDCLNNDSEWKIVSNKSSVEFIKQHLDYSWDWGILTSRFYKSIDTADLGDSRWTDKWDWGFLTSHLDLDVVVDYLDYYSEKWDWTYLSNNLDKSFILDNLPNRDYVKKWDWKVLLMHRLDKDDLRLNGYLPTVATCLTSLEQESKNNCWTIICQKFTFDELQEMIRMTAPMKMGDLFTWDYLDFYNRDEFHLRAYLSENLGLIDWAALSRCNKIEDEFKWDKTLFSEKVWLDDVLSTLTEEEYDWDFKALSKISSLNSNARILSVKSPEWDWTYLCEHSPLFDKNDEFKRVFKRFSRWLDYEVLSRRRNSGVSESIIGSRIDASWNWTLLSENPSIKFSIDFIKDHRDKGWNWHALSSRNDLVLDNESLFGLSEKGWDWQALSNRTDLIYDESFIEHFIDKPMDWLKLSKLDSFIPNARTLSQLKGKSLDWKSISSNSRLDKQVLWDYRDLLDWTSVTTKHVDCSDIQFLLKYKDYLDWSIISKDESFIVSDGNLELFKDKVVWWDINRRKDFSITENTLRLFADEIDWGRASESHDIVFTEELIEEYRDKWDWNRLSRNSQIIDHLSDTLVRYKAELNCATFIDQFGSTPYIYHFTHMFPNAVDIIRSRKILCRNKSEGHFANAAGDNVHRRATAHDYARFYYRTQTPTQFYNECLGMDKESGEMGWVFGGYDDWGKKIWERAWKSYYPQAYRNGLPKCPMPVFFKFSLEEVIAKMPDVCYYSTGNMQTDWADVVKVTDNPTRLNVNGLYSTIKDGVNVYKQYSQQEFLVKEEFDFSKLNSFEIICFDEEQADILKSQLFGDPICEKITSGGWGIYHRNNRKLNISEDDYSISFTSEYREDNACISVLGPGLNSVVILNPDDVKKESDKLISAYPRLYLKKPVKDIEVRFVDERSREWVIYNSTASTTSSGYEESPMDFFMRDSELRDLFNTRVRHYTLKEHTQLVCEQFKKYFQNVEIPISHELMMVFLTLHDIGKPIAEDEGNKDNQYEHTTAILSKIDLDCCGNHYTEKEREILLALASCDCLGDYFKGLADGQTTVDLLSALAANADMALPEFFYLYMVYYQCDISSYTADAGGLRFLEYLFDYSDVATKKFDAHEGLIKMANEYWDKYLTLKGLVYDRKNL